MANEDAQPLDELLEEGGGDLQEQLFVEPETGSFLSRLPLKTIGIFAGICFVAVGAAYAVAGIMNTEPKKQAAAPAPLVDEGALPAEETKKEEPKTEAESEVPTIYTLDSIIVNLHNTEARRYLKATIAFAIKDDTVQEAIAKRKLILTDKLIQLLSSKTIEDIDGYQKKQDLKREIRDEVNGLLGIRDAVTQIYFTDLIIQ